MPAMRKYSRISLYLGYSVSAISFLVGVVLLSGLVLNYVPLRFRVMVGVVFVLMGIYRYVVTRTQARRQYEDEEE
jgi:cadmium resistance protein CadD (predicted permease)